MVLCCLIGRLVRRRRVADTRKSSADIDLSASEDERVVGILELSADGTAAEVTTPEYPAITAGEHMVHGKQTPSSTLALKYINKT